jgi:hypothetical protein
MRLKESLMLLARLVTGRYGYASGEENYRPTLVAAPGRGWVARLLMAMALRKRTD